MKRINLPACDDISREDHDSRDEDKEEDDGGEHDEGDGGGFVHSTNLLSTHDKLDNIHDTRNNPVELEEQVIVDRQLGVLVGSHKSIYVIA